MGSGCGFRQVLHFLHHLQLASHDLAAIWQKKWHKKNLNQVTLSKKWWKEKNTLWQWKYKWNEMKWWVAKRSQTPNHHNLKSYQKHFLGTSTPSVQDEPLALKVTAWKQWDIARQASLNPCHSKMVYFPTCFWCLIVMGVIDQNPVPGCSCLMIL